MVEDDKIKTTVSPFAMREGEVKTFDGKDKYVSINQIIQKINLGHITDIHFKILELVNEFEFITSRQLYQILKYRGEEIKSQDKLNTRLEQLIKTKILTRYYFTSEDGNGIFRVYCLEKMGKYLLNSRGIDCKWQPTDNVRPIPMIKKRLAGNQVIVAYMRKVKLFDKYDIKPQLTAKQLGKTFRLHGGVRLSKDGKSLDLIFEVVRREDEWTEKLIERMKLYEDFYTNFVQFDSGFEKVPQLILVCEDDKHIVEAYKEILTNKIEIPKIKLYFTTDLRQNSNSLEKTLMEFVVDSETKKIKASNVEIKLLS